LTSNARQHKIYKRGLEVVSKPQIRFKGKAQADRESAAYMGVCLGLRWGFEATSKKSPAKEYFLWQKI
jgi:hypothetical protein